jgi:hypothetical protein
MLIHSLFKFTEVIPFGEADKALSSTVLAMVQVFDSKDESLLFNTLMQALSTTTIFNMKI